MPDCLPHETCESTFYAGLNFECLLTKAGADDPLDGDSCFGPSCGAGKTCISGNFGWLPECGSDGFCCASYCDLNAPNTCPLADKGAECVAFAAKGYEPPPGMEHVGFCGLP